MLLVTQQQPAAAETAWHLCHCYCCTQCCCSLLLAHQHLLLVVMLLLNLLAGENAACLLPSQELVLLLLLLLLVMLADLPAARSASCLPQELAQLPHLLLQVTLLAGENVAYLLT
jgi:hypothetical protein